MNALGSLMGAVVSLLAGLFLSFSGSTPTVPPLQNATSSNATPSTVTSKNTTAISTGASSSLPPSYSSSGTIYSRPSLNIGQSVNIAGVPVTLDSTDVSGNSATITIGSFTVCTPQGCTETPSAATPDLVLSLNQPQNVSSLESTFTLIALTKNSAVFTVGPTSTPYVCPNQFGSYVPASIIASAQSWLVSQVGQAYFDKNFSLNPKYLECWPGFYRLHYDNSYFESLGVTAYDFEVVIDTKGNILQGTGTGTIPSCMASGSSDCQILITKNQATAIAKRQDFPLSGSDLGYSIAAANETGDGWAWYISDYESGGGCGLRYAIEINASTGKSVVTDDGEQTPCMSL